jgi:hypothetical protein
MSTENTTVAAIGPAAAGTHTAPVLRVTVEQADPIEFAAVPTLRFRARVQSGGRAVRSIALHTQVRIASTRRSYDAASRDRLAELFGTPDQWDRSLRSLLWTQVVTQVPEFEAETVVDIAVGCTYDFEVVATKYLHALADGEVPLEFLFSGTIFYSAGGTLQAARIPWDTEAAFRMPVRIWHDLMDRYFPHSAWLRLEGDTFDRLTAFRVRNALGTWEDAIEELLRRAQPPVGGR